MHCLDTDVAVGLMREEAAAVRKIKMLEEAGAGLAITSITLCELYRGAFLSSDKEKNLALVEELLERVTLLVQDKFSCMLFGQDYAFLKKKGAITQAMDLMIAGICKANNLALVTRNVRDFKNIPNLMVEKW